MYTTNIWVVLDEENLELAKAENGQALRFENEGLARHFAANNLTIWSCINVSFQHKLLKHEVNETIKESEL